MGESERELRANIAEMFVNILLRLDGVIANQLVLTEQVIEIRAEQEDRDAAEVEEEVSERQDMYRERLQKLTRESLGLDEGEDAEADL